MKLNWMYLAMAGVAGTGAFALYKMLSKPKPVLSREVKRKLPLANDLDTIHDADGNYDLDGVSFDIEGVIVSSDGIKSLIITT